MLLLLILLIALVALSVGGGFGYSRFGYLGFSPAGLLLITMVILYFTGYIRFR